MRSTYDVKSLVIDGEKCRNIYLKIKTSEGKVPLELNQIA